MSIRGNELLRNCIEELGISITDKQIDQFMKYYEMLIEKNTVMNLTAITELEDVIIKHFVDSLALVKSIDVNNYSSMIDVGTGAGFPGIPIKIMFPELEITLVDSLNKRINFLNEVINELNLSKIEAVHGRAEDTAKSKKYREQFDLCVSRAVANISTLSEYCIPFIKVGGMFVCYKAGNSEQEIVEGKKAINVLGGEIEDTIDFILPGTDINRKILNIKKVKTTPGKYPRKAGTPSREPIR